MRKIVMFPVVRIILGILCVLLCVALIQVPRNMLIDPFFAGESPILIRVLATALSVALSFFGYWFFVRFIERREVEEIARHRAPAEFLKGAAIGASLFTAVIAALWALGYYQVTSVNGLTPLFAALLSALFSGVVEEIIARGIIFRVLEESLGSVLALVISSLLFGFAHAGNENATLLSSLAIALEAGVLLGAAFMFTRRLWMVIGLHFAWNFTQGGIFGVSVSGGESQGLLASTLEGPVLLSGGEFGAEASVIAVIFCLAVAAFILKSAHHHGRFIAPFWSRNGQAAERSE